MTATKRRPAITRKVDLSDFSDDYQDCYAVVRLADFEEVSKINETDFTVMTNIDALRFGLQIVKQHFVSGKTRLITTDGVGELVDMEASDLGASTEMINSLYLTIMGVTLDPKATTTVATSNDEPTNDVNVSKTT